VTIWIWIWIETLVRCALAEVCTVPMLLVIGVEVVNSWYADHPQYYFGTCAQETKREI